MKWIVLFLALIVVICACAPGAARTFEIEEKMDKFRQAFGFYTVYEFINFVRNETNESIDYRQITNDILYVKLYQLEERGYYIIFNKSKYKTIGLADINIVTAAYKNKVMSYKIDGIFVIM